MASSSTEHSGSIGTVSQKGIPDEVDVAIVGSGGAGLMAALTAAKEGARVLVVESREIVGGATGISAGAAWIPNHGFSTKDLKVHDDLDQARRYIYGQGRDRILDHDLVEKFLETGPHVARFIEEHTSFGWIPTIWPDYRSDIDGASVGRALFPGPYSPEGLGENAKYVRPALTTGMAKNPLPFWLLGGIGIDDVWLAGPALIGALLEAGLRNGVDVRVETPATRLVTDESGVRGIVVRAAGAEHTVRATRGVLLASGGFESSTEITTTYLDAPFGVQVSPQGHDGIAVQLAQEVGADLTGMEDAWWMPGVQLPGEELEGRPLSRVFLGERALPHSIMVNSKGERFANEALAYDQFGQIMREVDPETGTMPNATAWLIFDHNYWTKFGIFGVTPGAEVPDYLHRADTLSELANRIGVDEVGLLRTVDRFNPEAARARDPQFHRGETLFDRYFGAYYPRLGKNSPDAVPRRHRKGADAHRRGDRSDREQARRTGGEEERPRTRAFPRGRTPGEDHPTHAEEPEVERAGTGRHRALLRARGPGQRARHRGRPEDRRTRTRAEHRRQGHSRPVRRRQRRRRTHEGLLRRRRGDDLARAGVRLPRGTGSSQAAGRRVSISSVPSTVGTAVEGTLASTGLRRR